MVDVNPPPQLRMPNQLRQNREVSNYFIQLEKILFQLWSKTGGGDDLILEYSDHGNLSGLSDDDHVNYLNTTRHDAIALNPHGVTFTQAVAEDTGTDITAAEAEQLTDGSYSQDLHVHESIAIKTANYTTVQSETVICTNTSEITITLNATPVDKEIISVKSTTTNIVNVTSSKLIDGETTIIITSKYDCPKIIYSSTQDTWFIV